MDGDMYESTLDTLTHLYPKLTKGGYVIIDDYEIPACRQAIEEYRKDHGIEDQIVSEPGNVHYWRKG